MNPPSQLKGSVTYGRHGRRLAVIIGGTSGIGLSTAKFLLQQRFIVVIGGRRDVDFDREPELRGFLKDGLLIFVKIDVTCQASVSEFFGYVEGLSVGIDVMINCAGIMKLSPLTDLRVSEWEEMINTNVLGLLRCIARAIHLFQKRCGGKIINIGSVAGHKVATPDGTVYSATKFAVAALSEGMRQELAELNISVTLVSPGATKTQLGQNSSNRDSKVRISDYYAKYGMEVEDVARQIAEIAVLDSTAKVSEVVLRSLHHRF